MEELTFCCDCANMDKESDGKCVDYKKEGK